MRNETPAGTGTCVINYTPNLTYHFCLHAGLKNNNEMEAEISVNNCSSEVIKRRRKDHEAGGLNSKKIKRYIAKQTRSLCSLETLYARLPFIGFIRGYDLDCLTGDLIAGLTCALTVIPQGIGYAPLAGLPLQVRMFTVYKRPPVAKRRERGLGSIFM